MSLLLSAVELVVLFVAAYFACRLYVRWVKRRAREVPERRRPERSEPIDLAAERYAYCSRRDQANELRQLRSVA